MSSSLPSKNFHGVQLLLDAVVDYLPSPADRKAVTGFAPKDKTKTLQERKADPKDPTFRYHLGLAYEKKGDTQRAKQSLDEALKQKPDYKEAAEARKRLEKS